MLNSPKLRVLVLAVVTQSACAAITAGPKKMYAGDDRPVTDLAVVALGHRGTLQVQAIDGESVGIGLPPAGLQVLPGIRKVQLLYIERRPGFSTRWEDEIALVAQAGHTYIPRGRKVAGDKVTFWFDDKEPGYPAKCLDYGVYGDVYFGNKQVPGCEP